MPSIPRLAVTIVSASMLAMALWSGNARAQAQPRLPLVTLSAGMHAIQAEVADNFVSRMTGLMHLSLIHI